MTREAKVWSGLAILSLAWCVMTVVTGGGLLLPMLSAMLSTMCAGSPAARERVLRVAGQVFAGGTWRTVLIMFGAVMLIQLLPLEMALLMAGDVLAYVEALAFVSLLAARNRVRPALAALRDRLRSWFGPTPAPRTRARSVRARRPQRRPNATDSVDGRGLALA